MRGARRAGRKPRLDAEQLHRVDRALREGARAHGFGTELWTLPRVAAVVQKVTGVKYHPGHVWKLLRSLKWSLQRPAKQARERNEEARRAWMAERWPALKKTPGVERHGSSSKTRVLVAVSEGAKMAAPGEPRCHRLMAAGAPAGWHVGLGRPDQPRPASGCRWRPEQSWKAGAFVMSFLRHDEIYRSDVGI